MELFKLKISELRRKPTSPSEGDSEAALLFCGKTLAALGNMESRPNSTIANGKVQFPKAFLHLK